jgi:hypothetical protein
MIVLNRRCSTHTARQLAGEIEALLGIRNRCTSDLQTSENHQHHKSPIRGLLWDSTHVHGNISAKETQAQTFKLKTIFLNSDGSQASPNDIIIRRFICSGCDPVHFTQETV